MTIDDKHIIRTIRKFPEEGFRLLIGKYKEAVYWHIRRLVVSHDDAQDAAQEAFVRIYRSFPNLQDENLFRGWMFRIATNEALRMLELRKKDVVSLDEDGSTIGQEVMADEYVDYTDLETVKLQKAILSLPTKQQLAFNLRYYDELSYEEIAEAIGSTEAAAKTNFHIAKEKIIKYMNEND